VTRNSNSDERKSYRTDTIGIEKSSKGPENVEKTASPAWKGHHTPEWDVRETGRRSSHDDKNDAKTISNESRSVGLTCRVNTTFARRGKELFRSDEARDQILR